MSRNGTVVSHWHQLIDEFNTSGLEFYEKVEEAVKTREVPDAVFSRAEFKEAGIGSAKREYLRIERKNVAFDLCAAPYGTGYFFSWWVSRLGPEHPFLYVLAFFFGIPILTVIVAGIFGDSCGAFLAMPLVFLSLVVGVLFLAKAEVFGPEELIVQIPYVGRIYSLVFNPFAYYSLDTALMFQESVGRAVHEVINGELSEQGLKMLTDEQQKPSIRDLAR